MSRVLSAVVALSTLAIIGVPFLEVAVVVRGAELSPPSDLAQFKMQCVSGIANTGKGTKDRAFIDQQFFSVLQIGPTATPVIVNADSVCRLNNPWMRGLVTEESSGAGGGSLVPVVGDWTVNPVFLSDGPWADDNVLVYYNGMWHQKGLFGKEDYLPTANFNFGKPTGTPAVVYNVKKGSDPKDAHNATLEVFFNFNQGSASLGKNFVPIPCYMHLSRPGKCLLSYNTTTPPTGHDDEFKIDKTDSVFSGQSVSVGSSSKVGAFLGVTVGEFPNVSFSFFAAKPCGLVANVRMEVLYLNQTLSVQEGFGRVPDKSGSTSKFIILHGDDKDGFFWVCRLQTDMRGRTEQNFAQWSINTNLKIGKVNQVTADSHGILMSLTTMPIQGKTQDLLVPFSSSERGKIEIPKKTPHTTEITPLSVQVGKQRRFIVQYDGLLSSFDIANPASFTGKFTTIWTSTVGCLNDADIWRERHVLLCWSNGKTSSFPKGMLMMVNASSGEPIPDSEESYMAQSSFGLTTNEQLSLPFQITLTPKSTEPTLWFLGSKLPDQIPLTNPPLSEVHCLIGMELTVPRHEKCSNRHHKNDDDGGKTAGKVVLAVFVIAFIGFIVLAMTMGYRRHKQRRSFSELSDGSSPFDAGENGAGSGYGKEGAPESKEMKASKQSLSLNAGSYGAT